MASISGSFKAFQNIMVVSGYAIEDPDIEITPHDSSVAQLVFRLLKQAINSENINYIDIMIDDETLDDKDLSPLSTSSQGGSSYGPSPVKRAKTQTYDMTFEFMMKCLSAYEEAEVGQKIKAIKKVSKKLDWDDKKRSQQIHISCKRMSWSWKAQIK